MGELRLWITMSVDGFVAGPAQDADNPLGVGGMHLHEWVFPLAAWRQAQGLTGGEVNESSPVIEAAMADIGATDLGVDNPRMSHSTTVAAPGVTHLEFRRAR